MDLAVNKVLVAPKINSRDEYQAMFTIVSYRFGSDEVVLIQQDRKSPKKPFVHVVGQPLEYRYNGERHLIRWSLFKCERYDFLNASHISSYQELSIQHNETTKALKKKNERKHVLDAKIDKRLQIVDAFEQFEQRKKAYFEGKWPQKNLKEFAKSLGTNADYVGDTLALFYAFGQTRESLIPLTFNCGTNPTIPQNTKHARDVYKTVRGRKRKSYVELQRPRNLEDTARVKDFYKNVLPEIKYYSFANLWSQFNAEYATNIIYDDGYSRKFFDYDPDRYLTYQQFNTVLKKVVNSKAKFDAIKRGSKAFRNDRKVLKSSVLKHVVGPSHMYEIDATVLDVHLVSKFCTDEVLPIGRPILYTVVDVATTAIVGFHLALDGPNAEAVTLALFNAMTNKEEFCKRWGYPYQQGDWPCHHVCKTLVIDRGTEYLDNVMARLIKAKVGLTHVDITEAYIGRAKGTVESLFNKLNVKCIHALPGAVLKTREKAQKHSSQSAILTIDDVYYTLIDEIISHNHKTVVKNKRTQEHVANNIEPTPMALWDWGLNELMDGGTEVEPTELMTALLPRQKANVTRHGIELQRKKITYQTDNKKFEDLRQEIVIDRDRSDYEIEVMVLPSWNQTVWFKNGNGKDCIVSFDVADSNIRLANLHFEEAYAILENESVFTSALTYERGVDDAVRVRERNERIFKNRIRLHGLKRSEGKSAVKGTRDNRKVDIYDMSKNHSSVVSEAIDATPTQTQLKLI